MYGEGSSLAAIGRVLEALPETVYSWFKKARWAQNLKDQEVKRRTAQRRTAAAVIALDELWSYVGSRRQPLRREVWA